MESMTRWQKFYRDDPKLGGIPPSQCAQEAAEVFTRRGIRRVLDVGCGAGRDTACLAAQGLAMTGVDAALSGLALARARQPALPYLAADARCLPFAAACFEGVYCYGLLHEFVAAQAHADVRSVVGEIGRVLRPDGLAVITVLAGEPQAGLPHVQLFSEAMFDEATTALRLVEKRCYEDSSCTGVPHYKVWWGLFTAENK